MSEERPIRIGAAARDVAVVWEEEGDHILGEGADVERVGDMTWTWRTDEAETGRVEFADAGPERGEARLLIDRRDGAAGARIAEIIDRLSEVLATRGIDRPVVAQDPHQGEAPEQATDPDQPL